MIRKSKKETDEIVDYKKDMFQEEEIEYKLNLLSNILSKLVSCIPWILKICIIVVGTIVIINVHNKSEKLSKEIHVKETIELYSIGTGDKIYGSFRGGFSGFIISYGSIEEVDYYCCYRKKADGGKTYYKFEMDETTVYETLKSDEQAYVEVLEDGLGNSKGYRLYVPENTIVQEIDLSLVK